MPIPVVLAALVKSLAASGLGLIGNAVLAKGKEAVEEKLGVNLDEAMGSEAGRIRLQELQIEREEDLHAFVLAQREQELKADAMAYADTASARDMNTRVNESVHASWLTKNVAAIIALFVIVAGMIVLYSTNEADVRTAVVGLMTLVLGFYFGTSVGSRSKDDTINAAMRRGQP